MATLQTPQLERASFRGVLFTCTSHDIKAGRRTADHVFPKRDLGYREDMGRADREFTLTAYLNGDNVFDQRDRLLAALEAPGPGELFHPWLGRLMVVAKPSSVREARNARRQAELSLTFIEAGRASVNTGWRDTRASLRTAAKAVAPAAETSLANRYSQSRTPGFVKGDASMVLTEAAVGGEQIRLNTPGQALSGFEVMRAIDTVLSTATTGIASPAKIVTGLSGMMLSLAGASPDQRRAYHNFESVFRRFGSLLPGIPLTTSNRRRQRQNRDALTSTVRLLALSSAVQVAASVPHRDYQEAVTWRTRVCEWCDEETQAASAARDDELFGAVTGLRTAYVDRVTEDIGTLAPVRAVRLPTVMPTLAAAYRIHGDARRAEEVEARNRSRMTQLHPGFLPADAEVDFLGA